MAKRGSCGYIYALMDPRLPEDKNIIYVGVGRRPWENIITHLKYSQVPELRTWAANLKAQYPEGLQVLGSIICDIFHGEEQYLPSVPEGMVRVPWKVLDLAPDDDMLSILLSTTQTTVRKTKQDWVGQLRREGHPLFNHNSGPKRQK